jgi:ABC-type Mn2+/Zn2+ transport system permease subunit
MIMNPVLISLLPTCAMAAACAGLSVFVIARRWAFVGEGISHSSFGGAGLAWLIMLAFPALIDRPWVVSLSVVVFCLGTAMAIGYLSRGDRVTSDAAIAQVGRSEISTGFMIMRLSFSQDTDD